MDAEFLALVQRVAALEGRLAALEGGPHAALAGDAQPQAPQAPLTSAQADEVHKGWRAWVQQHVTGPAAG